VSIEYSVLDTVSSTKSIDLVFPTVDDETFSAASYVEVLSQL
jgi:hypothetical protein